MSNTKNSDGYRWRKYGRKKVKGSSHPRNYYKCNVQDCPARKYMEKIVSEDGTVQYNTIYKGQHCHEPPSVTEIPRIETQESFKRIVQAKMVKIYFEIFFFFHFFRISKELKHPKNLPFYWNAYSPNPKNNYRRKRERVMIFLQRKPNHRWPK